MFNTLNTVPFRNRSRIQQLRSLAQRNGSMGQYEHLWIPFPNSIVSPNLFNTNWPTFPNYYTSMPEPLLPQFMTSSDIGHHESCLDELDYYEETTNRTLSFGKAAALLNDAIDSTIRFCKDAEKQFENEMSNVAVWADPKCVDELWSMKLDWDGAPASSSSGKRDSRQSANTITYNTVMRKLFRAFEDLRGSHVVSASASRGLDESQQYPERVRTALNKLIVTFDGIEELVGSVRTRRKRMSALLKELNSAQNQLHDTRDLWKQHCSDQERRHAGDDRFKC